MRSRTRSHRGTIKFPVERTTTKDGVVIDWEAELTVGFCYHEPEPATRTYPGHDRFVEVLAAREPDGRDWMDDLTEAELGRVEDACWEHAMNPAEGRAAP